MSDLVGSSVGPVSSIRKSFNFERKVFRRLKSDCSLRSKAEFELAISVLIRKYNTTIYENRFVVGGAVEMFVYALLKSVGIDCTLYGAQTKSGDILLPADRKLSVKGTFTGGPTDIRLLNKLGGGERCWDTATLFVVANIGIVYGDPNLVDNSYIQDAKDALILKRKGLESLIDNTSNVFEMEIAKKPPTETTLFSRKASTAVGKQILLETDSDNLLDSIQTGNF